MAGGFVLGSLVDETYISKRLSDGAEDQYLRATLVDKAGNTMHTVDMDHVTGGLYVGTVVLTGAHKFLVANYTVFSDSGRTTENTFYDLAADDIRILWADDILLGGPNKAPIVKPKVNIDEVVDKLSTKIDEATGGLSTFDPAKDTVDLKNPESLSQPILERIRAMSDEMQESFKGLSAFQDVLDSLDALAMATNDNQKITNSNISKATKAQKDELKGKVSMLRDDISVVESSLASVLELFAGFLKDKIDTENVNTREIAGVVKENAEEVVKKFSEEKISDNLKLVQKMLEQLNIIRLKEKRRA